MSDNSWLHDSHIGPIEKQTPEQREISRLRQSLMTIATWARCFDARRETAEKAMRDIVIETERALGAKK